MATLTKDKFRNATEGQLGVIILDAKGQEKAIALGPGQDVWLSEDEQVLTAQAPRNPDDNPLQNGALELLAEAGEVKSQRPLRPVPDGERPVSDQAEIPEETGAAPAPAGAPAKGKRPAAEEVGTPDAVGALGERDPETAKMPRPAARARRKE